MKKIHIISLIFIAVLIGYFIINLSEETSEYSDFATAYQNQPKAYHIVGQLVKSKPQKYEPLVDPNHFEFYMTDERGQQNKVIYKGAKPDGFDQTEKIVVAGRFVDDQFKADQILMKCPSKYVDEKSNV